MVRITAQQVTDGWGHPSLLDDVFLSELRPVRVDSVRESVFECVVSDRGKRTLVELKTSDRFSLLAMHLISRGFPEHTLVSYGYRNHIKMVRVGKTEFRSHKHTIYEKALGE